jgi:hypothetical protein
MADNADKVRLSIAPRSVAEARAQLRAIVRGIPLAEAAVEGFSDWQVIEAVERCWAGATTEVEAPAGSTDQARSVDWSGRGNGRSASG